MKTWRDRAEITCPSDRYIYDVASEWVDANLNLNRGDFYRAIEVHDEVETLA